jgi:acyl-CoA reductase-like NAD-dependent aldehyde dehydrogenase
MGLWVMTVMIMTNTLSWTFHYSAAIFTKDINKIMTYSSRVKAGTVW